VDAFRVIRTLAIYERAVGRALAKAKKGDRDALRKAASFQRVVGDLKRGAVERGLDLHALRKAFDPARRDALLSAMSRAGADTFEGKIAWVEAKLPDVTDPASFVGWLVQGDHELRKARKLHGKRRWRGLDISIENAAGTERTWHNPDTGESGGSYLPNAYGYIRGTIGADGDHVDVICGPHMDSAVNVYLVRQRKAPDFQAYDEDKVLLGFGSDEEARSAYFRQYDDPRYIGDTIYVMPADQFAQLIRVHRDTPPLHHWRAIMLDPAHTLAQTRPASLTDVVRKAWAGVPMVAEVEPAPASWADVLRKAAGAAAGARSHKYLRRVPTGDPKKPWRYYYTAASLGRGVTQGESVRLGDGHSKIAEVHEDGVTVEDHLGQRRRFTAEQWHDHMHEHHGDSYVAAVDKRVKAYAKAVYRHIPREMLESVKNMAELKDRAPHLYDALARDFHRAGMSPQQGREMVAWVMARKGWAPDARAALLGAAVSPEHGKAVVKDRKAIGAEAAEAAGSREVSAAHVAEVLEKRGMAEAPKEPEAAPEAEPKAAAETKPKKPRVARIKGHESEIAATLGDQLFKGDKVTVRHDDAQETAAVLHTLFGRAVSDKELAGMIGVPDGCTLNVEATDAGTKDASLYLTGSGPGIATMARQLTFDDDGLRKIYNCELVLTKDEQKGGLGRRIFASQVANAAKMGVGKISCSAARSDGHYNGYYTWARFGYNVAPDKADSFARYSLAYALSKPGPPPVPKGIDGKSTPRDIMKTAKGRAWWMAKGEGWSASFDLTGGSYSMRTLAAYLQLKNEADAKKKPAP
jgi:hypothetical protein